MQAHPNSTIIRTRLKQARQTVARGLAAFKPKPTTGKHPAVLGALSAWIKALHNIGDRWTVAPGERTWVSDAGKHDDQGRRVYRADGEVWGEPSWQVGDPVGLYLGYSPGP